METQTAIRANGGLEGVIAAETRLSMVDGERGELIVAGHRSSSSRAVRSRSVVALLWDAAGAVRARAYARSCAAGGDARAPARRGAAPRRADGRAAHGGRHV